MISCSCFSSATTSVSSANHRLVMFLPPLLTFSSYSFRESVIMRSRNLLKRIGERKHPCIAPSVILYHSSVLLFI